jgi:hypothetical protein
MMEWTGWRRLCPRNEILLLILLKCKQSVIVVSSAFRVPVFPPTVHMIIIVVIVVSIWIRINYIWADSRRKLCSCCSLSCLHNRLRNHLQSSLLTNPLLAIRSFTVSEQKALVEFTREVGLGLFHLGLVAFVVKQEFVRFFKHSIILGINLVKVAPMLNLIGLLNLISFIDSILICLFLMWSFQMYDLHVGQLFSIIFTIFKNLKKSIPSTDFIFPCVFI